MVARFLFGRMFILASKIYQFTETKMNELAQPFDLAPEQQDTTALIRRLLGKRTADRYVDFCRLAAGALPLRVSSPIAAHALRELESIIRQTLEVPMDVAVTASARERERLEKANASLEELGYGDVVVKQVINQLRPRLSHKEQIEKIVLRLGLAADGDVARAWKAIADAHREAHGGRALHQSYAVDDVFRATWQAPFDMVMRGLMVALQGKYTAFMQRIDQLVAMQDRGAAVTAFSKEIPGALPLLWHFFNNLQTPDWLPHLVKKNLLLAPQSLTDEVGDDGVMLGRWPAGRYLQRMALSDDEAARSLVIGCVRKIAGSTHPEVQQLGMEILATLPPAEAVPLIDIAEGWLSVPAWFVMAPAPHHLIKGFAKGGEPEAALRMTRALFKVFSDDGELKTLFDRHMYEHFLPKAVQALAPFCGADAVGMLCELLDQAVRIGRKVGENPHFDYSHHLSGTISEHGTKHDVIDALVGGIVRASKLSIATDPGSTHDVLSQIDQHTPRIFARISLHVLALTPGAAPDRAEASLTDHDLVDATWCRAEYGELARVWFPSLPAARQAEILAYADSLPDKYRDGWTERFQVHENRMPTEDEEREYNVSIVRDVLWLWREVLPFERREAIELGGAPDAWSQRLQEPDKSPLDGSDFVTRPLGEVVTFLETWRPSSGERKETITALAQALRDAAAANVTVYSAGALSFASLAPIYVRQVLEGLLNAVRNEGDLDWVGVLALLDSVSKTAAQVPGSGIEGDDRDWFWARKAAIELMADGLWRGRDGIPLGQAKCVQDLVLAFYRSAPRKPDTEDFEESYSHFPYFGAKSTSRGAAVELCVLLIFWLSNDPASEVGKAPREAFDKLAEIREIFDSEVSDRSSDGRIPRAIIGRHLNWLAYFAESWLSAQLPNLFPNDDLTLRDASWISHLVSDRGPNRDLAVAMRDCYVAEIDRLNEMDSGSDPKQVKNRLSEYLVILFIQQALPDEVFDLFWNTAPTRSRQHAMWFLGTQLQLPDEDLPEDMRLRARSYWDRRLASAKSSSDSDHYREELGALGQFFYREGINAEWLMDQVIAMSEAGFTPRESYGVVDRLAKFSSEFPDRAAQAIASLVKNRHFDRSAHLTQPAALRTIFVNGLGTGLPAISSVVVEAINYLATLGNTDFLDLLPKGETRK